MIDAITKKPLNVGVVDGRAVYIIVPLTQLDQVTSALDANQFHYWVSEDAISIDDDPEIVYVRLYRGARADQIQKLLDEIP